MFGLFLALPSVISILQNDSLQWADKVVTAILALVFGLVASAVAVFQLQRI